MRYSYIPIKCTHCKYSMSSDICIHPFDHHHFRDTEYFYHPQKFLHTHLQSIPLTLRSRQKPISFLSGSLSFAFSKISKTLNCVLCVSGFFCSACCFWESSVLWCISVIHFLLRTSKWFHFPQSLSIVSGDLCLPHWEEWDGGFYPQTNHLYIV